MAVGEYVYQRTLLPFMVAREQREEKTTEASPSPASIFMLYVHNPPKDGTRTL